MRNPEYANAATLRKRGIDPFPRHGDVVEWVDNGEQWTVDEHDDITGPTALKTWPDGTHTWKLVRLIRRAE
jgi:hypothetical protein